MITLKWRNYLYNCGIDDETASDTLIEGARWIVNGLITDKKLLDDDRNKAIDIYIAGFDRDFEPLLKNYQNIQLASLLFNSNPKIKRLAKGILKELEK